MSRPLLQVGLAFVLNDNTKNKRRCTWGKTKKKKLASFFTYDLATGLPSMLFDFLENMLAQLGPRFDARKLYDYNV